MPIFKLHHQIRQNLSDSANDGRKCGAFLSEDFSRVSVPFVMLIIIWLFYLAIPSSVPAKRYDQLFETGSEDTTQPWHIQADDIIYDKDTDHFIAKGNVSITKKEIRLLADFVRFDRLKMRAVAIGNVIMTAGGDTLTGNRMEMDLKSGTGTMYEGTVFMKENHYYISGEKIEKIGKKTYSAYKATVSTCDGDNPMWKITGRNSKVTIEGYGYITNATIWTKNIPVFFSPVLVFPAKLKRQSGFLTPQMGYSDRKGYEYIQPFFFAINDSSDATFYLHHMERRGEKLGAEYRYVLSDRSKGTSMFDFLDDSKVDDGTGDSSSRWGFEDDRFLRPDSDRYWYRSKHDQKLPFDFTAKLDLDVVSDQDYLHEFRVGYTGFEETKTYFEQNFGRGIDDYNDTTRVNRFSLERRWEKSSLNTEFRWYDNVIHRRLTPDLPDRTLHQLPFIDFDVSKNRVFYTPFYFEMNSGYTHFYRDEGMRGHRADLYPRLYLPIRAKNYFTIEPSVGIRETVWHLDEFDAKTNVKERTSYRDLYDINVNLSTDLYNIFHINGKDIDKIKHTIRPEVSYSFIPEKDQDDLPAFDRSDRIGKRNIISYSLINTLTSRMPQPVEKEDEATNYTYREIFRLKLSQGYDINEANDKDKEEKKPFSNIGAELDINPFDYLSFRANTKWSPYESDLLDSRLDLLLSDKRRDSLFVRHRYQRDSTKDRNDGNESIYAKLTFNISQRISTFFEYERNLYDDEDILSGLGMLYKAQCWAIDFRYTDRADDQTYSVVINFFGLGGFGTSRSESK